MIKTDVNSNAQSWELEVTCKNKKYMEAVVTALLKYGMINFEVESVEYNASVAYNGEWDGRYLIFMWCSWFDNLKSIAIDLADIEKKLS